MNLIPEYLMPWRPVHFWPAIIGAGASLLGGFLASEGAEDRNEAQIQQAQETNLFNAEQARINREFNAAQAIDAREWSAEQAAKQMDFQRGSAQDQRDYGWQTFQVARDFSESLSNSSYQRAVNDLKLAGLNPMLAYSRGGASTPSFAGPTSTAPQGAMGVATVGQGSAAQGHMARIEDVVAPAMNSAATIAQLAASIDKTRAETAKIEQETVTERNTSDVRHYDIRKRIEDIYGEMARTDLTREEINRVKAEVQNLVKTGKEIEARTLVHQINAQHGSLDLPRAANESAAQDTWWKRNVTPFLPDLLKGAGSAAGFSRLK